MFAQLHSSDIPYNVDARDTYAYERNMVFSKVKELGKPGAWMFLHQLYGYTVQDADRITTKKCLDGINKRFYNPVWK
ncbi:MULTISPECIES: hypothetical protein [unclassified Endozoicomonas]|uniref:hypothetical protein n=1 Tax=unclassified Endozoicomonas TaxID=2644528 RepID=UPI00214815F9|nr:MULTISPECIES: hypothetical protein [unclassified Endozoicomonas]